MKGSLLMSIRKKDQCDLLHKTSDNTLTSPQFDILKGYSLGGSEFLQTYPV